jgi:RHS repeat-associated protein
MNGRSFSNENYRFAWNGKEKEDEIFEGCLAFEARIYDSRLGRWMSTDPREGEYAWQSTYVYFGNSPIKQLDYLGMGDETDPPKESYTRVDGKTTTNADITKPFYAPSSGIVEMNNGKTVQAPPGSLISYISRSSGQRVSAIYGSNNLKFIDYKAVGKDKGENNTSPPESNTSKNEIFKIKTQTISASAEESIFENLLIDIDETETRPIKKIGSVLEEGGLLTLNQDFKTNKYGTATTTISLSTNLPYLNFEVGLSFNTMGKIEIYNAFEFATNSMFVSNSNSINNSLSGGLGSWSSSFGTINNDGVRNYTSVSLKKAPTITLIGSVILLRTAPPIPVFRKLPPLGQTF